MNPILIVLLITLWLFVLRALGKAELHAWRFLWGSVGLFVILMLTVQPVLVQPLARCVSALAGVVGNIGSGYVQLVVDQINLKSNRDNEEIITDILGTLDASSNKYWTFSRDQAMLFVKDVLETNKYKGFTTATYYVSDSAREFLDTLKQDRVTHSQIEVDEKEYIASGVTFSYQGGTYRLCLLTNRSVLLDNNNFLGAKVNLLTTVALTLLLLMMLPVIFARRIRLLMVKEEEQEESIWALNGRVEQLNKRLSEKDLHDTRYNLWRGDAIVDFMEKLEERGARPVSVVEVCCADIEARETFLQSARYSLDKQVLRFELGEHDLLLVFVQVEEDTVVLSLLPLMGRGTSMGRRYTTDPNTGLNAATVRRKFELKG